MAKCDRRGCVMSRDPRQGYQPCSRHKSKTPWVFRRAKWWQFWLPGSGIVGGLIGSFLLWVVLRGIYCAARYGYAVG